MFSGQVVTKRRFEANEMIELKIDTITADKKRGKQKWRYT